VEIRTLGDTGIQVSAVGLGLAALGRPGYINLGHDADTAAGRTVEAMQARCHRVLDLAWSLGVRYFDAARSYGRAEAFLAAWLGSSGQAPAVGSKWGYRYTADWQVDAEVHEVKEHSRAHLERQWRETLELLGAHLDLYQIHSATLDSGVLDDPAVLDRLAEIKAGGTAVGLTLSGPRQAQTLERALAVRRDGRRLFDTVQATWNALEPSAGPALAAARAEGMGVIVKEAVANGRLTDRAPDAGAARRLLDAQARRLGTSVDGFAIAAVLARPWADVVLSGAATEAQLRSNLAAADLAWDTEAEESLDALAEPAAEYWATRARLAWN
jgi:aryl-alcohol dehydrogenase-like predicted oxidoreductase